MRRRQRRWLLAAALALAALVAGLVLPPSAQRAGLPGGWPDPVITDGLHWVRILKSPGFYTGYSEWRGAPLWVAYRSGWVENPAGPPRPERFTRDWRVFHQPGPRALSGSGYGRGHLAPNYAISRLYGRQAQLATFRMTNIVAQRPDMNRGVWQRIEELETDAWSREAEQFWVVTGPVFDDVREWVGQGVEVPDALYRVLLARTPGGEWQALSFIVPQSAPPRADLRRYVTTVDAVEARIGFDLFPGLEPGLEARIEAATPSAFWRLDTLSTRPGRYTD